jgi:hypothetical protein
MATTRAGPGSDPQSSCWKTTYKHDETKICKMLQYIEIDSLHFVRCGLANFVRSQYDIHCPVARSGSGPTGVELSAD